MNDSRIFAKCAWRLVPLMMTLLIVNYIDRVNVGFAALTMNRDLGFSPAVYGAGAGLVYVGYSLFQVPANAVLTRLGVRRWIFCIMAAWGAISASFALVRTPDGFYALRVLLGAAEAGLFPGLVFYLCQWFPPAWRGRIFAGFTTAIPVAFVIGGPLSSALLEMDGLVGLRGWQWLFLLEGVPAFVLAFAVLRLLPDGPAQAVWLEDAEKARIIELVARENAGGSRSFLSALHDVRVIGLGCIGCGFVIAMSVLWLWLPQVVHSLGYSNFATGFVVSLLSALTIPAMILWARHSDASGERIWHTALAGLSACFGFCVAGFCHDPTIVLLGLFCAGMGLYSYYGPFFSLPATFLSGPALASGIALLNCIAATGGFIGPTTMGILRERTGSFAGGMLALAGLMLLVSLAILMMGRAIAPRPILETAGGAPSH